MDTEYFLVTSDQSIPLFKLPFEYKAEEPAIFDFCAKFQCQRDLVAEDVIRDQYFLYSGRPAAGSSPLILLKILLANGWSIRSLTEDDREFTLAKDHFAITYEGHSDSQIIQIGSFFRTSTANADEQFPEFCKWLDSLCGVNGMAKNLGQQFLISGFSIAANENKKLTWLAKADERGGIIAAIETTLIYLSNDQE